MTNDDAFQVSTPHHVILYTPWSGHCNLDKRLEPQDFRPTKQRPTKSPNHKSQDKDSLDHFPETSCDGKMGRILSLIDDKATLHGGITCLSSKGVFACQPHVSTLMNDHVGISQTGGYPKPVGFNEKNWDVLCAPLC